MLFLNVAMSCMLNAGTLNPDTPFYDSRISLVDEFIKRFNGSDQDSIRSARVRDIVNLFNISNFTSENDPAYLRAVAFAEEVVDSGYRIAYTDSLWYADVLCAAVYDGKPVDMKLRLVVENVGPEMYRWAIRQAHGEILSLPPSAVGKGFMILPDDHETNFMSLTDMTATQTDCICNYAAEGVKIDPTSVFFTMVYDGRLTVRHAKSVDFVFNRIPGWSFTLRKIERESSNSGWLIDSLTKL